MKKGFFLPYKDENVPKSVPYVIYFLIAINVLVFVYSLSDFENIITSYGFTPSAFSLVTMFTAMFLHGGFGHIFGNMLYLFIFGDNVEDRFGKIKFVLFYLGAGIAATLAHYLIDPSSAIPAIGASGAISGVLGAYLVFFPKAPVHVLFYRATIKVPAYALIGLWFLLQLVSGIVDLFGFSGGGIAFWAHIGGFVFGYAVARMYNGGANVGPIKSRTKTRK